MSFREDDEIPVKTHLILGLGVMGKRHARLLLQTGQRVLGVEPAPLLNWQASFPIFTTVDEIPVEEFDTVWICTPTSLHFSQAAWALSLGKHVFIEKPTAVTYEEGRRILALHRMMERRPMIWVSCNMRFHPAVMELKKAVDCNMIGRPFVYRSHFSRNLEKIQPASNYRGTYRTKQTEGGGIILEAIQDIDLALWFNGPARKIRALAAQSDLFDMDAEDMASIIILHDDRILSELHMDFLRKDTTRGIEIIGEYGSLEWISRGRNPEEIKVTYFPAGESPSILYQVQLESHDEMFLRQMTLFLKEIADDPPYFTNIADAVRGLEIGGIARREFDSLS